jgi:hypothetical protein
LPLTDTAGFLKTDGAGNLSWQSAGGLGTVTLVNTASPLSGGPFTTSGTISCATCVTTGGGQSIGGTETFNAVTIGSTFILSAFTGSTRCLEIDTSGVVFAATCGSGTVASVTASSPITSSGGVNPNIACPDCMTLSTSQTVLAPKNWEANQTFNADALYAIGTRAIEASVIYSRAIESQKFQFSDPLVPGAFWTTQVGVSGPGLSTFTLNDTVAALAFKISRSTTSFTQVLGDFLPLVASTQSIGSAALPWKMIQFDNPPGSIPIIKLGVNTVLDSNGAGNFYGGMQIGGIFQILSTGTPGCLQADASGVVTTLGTLCAGSGTVTSIATNAPLSGGPITTSGTISCSTCLTTVGGQTINGIDTFLNGVVGSVFNSTTTGPSIAFQLANSKFMVDGNGNVSAYGSFNATGASSYYEINGVNFLDASRNAQLHSISIDSGYSSATPAVTVYNAGGYGVSDNSASGSYTTALHTGSGVTIGNGTIRSGISSILIGDHFGSTSSGIYIPSIGACGVLTAGATDTRGEFTTTNSGCTLTFGASYGSTPICVASVDAGGNNYAALVQGASAAGVTFNSTVSGSNHRFTYICMK